MKITKILHIPTNKISYVINRKKFCEDNNLTYRLMSYTLSGKRNHHKQYKILESNIDFVLDKNGEIVLWDNSLKGRILKQEQPINLNTIELEKENIFLTKELKKSIRQKQQLTDKLNFMRKVNRIENKQENFNSIFNNKLEHLLKQNVPKVDTYLNLELYNDDVALLMLSDLHIGQLVDTRTNMFNYNIAEYRLKKVFDELKKEIEQRNITTIYIALLGDLIHAQSVLTKPDMKLSAEFPEVQATVKAFYLLAKHIDELSILYNIKIAGVIGNESRFSNHMLPSNLRKEAQNNMDYLIFEMLKQRYVDTDNVEFINSGNEIEDIVDIFGYKFLLCHGDRLNHSNLHKSVEAIKYRFNNISNIDMVIFGHIHSIEIGNDYVRNASLVGSNAYSDKLGIPKSTISQTVLILNKDYIKTIPIKIKE